MVRDRSHDGGCLYVAPDLRMVLETALEADIGAPRNPEKETGPSGPLFCRDGQCATELGNIMKTSDRGIQAIEGYEGIRLKAYLDSVNVPTIGVGHTLGVHMGDVITKEQAEEFLRADLEDAEYAVNKYVLMPINQSQFDALVSFVFNLGSGAFKGSTLLKRLNAGLYQEAANEFLKWNQAGGKVLAGLAARRAAERAMFREQ